MRGEESRGSIPNPSSIIGHVLRLQTQQKKKASLTLAIEI